MINSTKIRKGVWEKILCPICNEDQELTQLGKRQEYAITRNFFFEFDFNDTVCEKCGFVFERLIPDDSYLKNNHHRIDDNPPQSETPHRSHFYNLMRIDLLPKELSIDANKIFSSLRDLQNKVSGTNGDFQSSDNFVRMRPQIIQYPSGGGFFGEHFHPLEPHRIGLITGLSRKGIDYKTGGTTFKTPHGFVDSGEHDLGDITLFRYNLPHAVTEVDPKDKLDWDSEKGRWTMILPHY